MVATAQRWPAIAPPRAVPHACDKAPVGIRIVDDMDGDRSSLRTGSGIGGDDEMIYSRFQH